MNSIRVEVVLARPERADVQTLTLAPGSTVSDALAAAGLEAPAGVGIHGRKVAPGTTLADGDRVEIYRPLTLDPGEARRRRARKRRQLG